MVHQTRKLYFQSLYKKQVRPGIRPSKCICYWIALVKAYFFLYFFKCVYMVKNMGETCFFSVENMFYFVFYMFLLTKKVLVKTWFFGEHMDFGKNMVLGENMVWGENMWAQI